MYQEQVEKLVQYDSIEEKWELIFEEYHHSFFSCKCSAKIQWNAEDFYTLISYFNISLSIDFKQNEICRTNQTKYGFGV